MRRPDASSRFRKFLMEPKPKAHLTEVPMRKPALFLVSAFLWIVALAHAARLAFQVPVTVGNVPVPAVAEHAPGHRPSDARHPATERGPEIVSLANMRDMIRSAGTPLRGVRGRFEEPSLPRL